MREARRKRIRAKISGTPLRPRLCVFRSNKALYVQLVDDTKGHTLAAATGNDAKALGAEIAKIAIAKKIKRVVFDRGGYAYHGKIKVLAEAAREGGLSF
ncbi:50S ribosomal protein L18 [Candidatus Woesebacteria bacterium RIFCSPHIGHO2_01_FULL_44_10]|uniref:Large ribosomal subunit protein uL18 n=1 Tax=Candidatus Woesebacteria bacterium RIFCSPLOWO2_01_FULL_44_14 TaxID=1802525 RepID=A0A1F8C226_9BACT|nr:MAG: 50S ribosomal protein L18 [Candidatus Woesebacteria bacterium RIFCSPHIGHO2_01_FULL_44_10]OGM54709.1 MAG: 50S ribosomal protein L18 [Candidatus Woesebacteria bacterium RIFCSPHIGHO2_12_FULL_44_11]OGM70180.1 MAG: 50S ribosomal protein L18 [Candidatus Woesebacteria bacterium RIFCSPLOWO2_01_FULL_44_14]